MLSAQRTRGKRLSIPIYKEHLGTDRLLLTRKPAYRALAQLSLAADCSGGPPDLPLLVAPCLTHFGKSEAEDALCWLHFLPAQVSHDGNSKIWNGVF